MKAALHPTTQELGFEEGMLVRSGLSAADPLGTVTAHPSSKLSLSGVEYGPSSQLVRIAQRLNLVVEVEPLSAMSRSDR